MTAETIVKMARVVDALKTLVWVRKNIPGDVAEAICWTEIHAALKEIDRKSFDPRASLDYYRKQQEGK